MRAQKKEAVRVAIDGPASDETLSSVLDRSANFWGVDRTQLLAAIAPENGAGDADAPSRALLKAMEAVTGVATGTLVSLAIRVTPEFLQPECRISYCPQCWANDVERGREPYFRRQWALSAVLTCELHGTLLYAWETDDRGERRPPPTRMHSRSDDTLWRSDLAHAMGGADRRVLKSLATFTSQANVALIGTAVWPNEWRGNVESGRALTDLLGRNPAPFPERLAMDRLVPNGPDERWFAGHRRASPGKAATGALSPLRRIGDPAIRRTLWWLLARTIVVDWAPLPIRGSYSVCTSIESWWRVFGDAISAHAACAYQELGYALEITGQVTSGYSEGPRSKEVI